MRPLDPQSAHFPGDADEAHDPVVALLNVSLDVSPPPGLSRRALAAIEARRRSAYEARARRWAWSAAAFGCAGLAGAIALVGRIARPEPYSWVGELAVEGAHGFTVLKNAVLTTANWLGLFDWVMRLADSLATASQAIVLSSVRDLTPALPGAVLLTLLTGIALMRAERARRERGMSHGTLHLFA
jgi:hypothetical protein